MFGLVEAAELRKMKMCSYCAPLLNYIMRSRCVPTAMLRPTCTYTHTSERAVGLCGVVMRYVGG